MTPDDRKKAVELIRKLKRVNPTGRLVLALADENAALRQRFAKLEERCTLIDADGDHAWDEYHTQRQRAEQSESDLASERIENTHLREAFVTMEKAANQREAEVERLNDELNGTIQLGNQAREQLIALLDELETLRRWKVALAPPGQMADQIVALKADLAAARDEIEVGVLKAELLLDELQETRATLAELKARTLNIARGCHDYGGGHHSGLREAVALDLSVFLRQKVADAERSIAARRESETCWRGGTDTEWLGASKLRGSGLRDVPVQSRAERLDNATRDQHIAARLEQEVAFYRSTLKLTEQFPALLDEVEQTHKALEAERIENAHLREAFVVMERAANQHEADLAVTQAQLHAQGYKCVVSESAYMQQLEAIHAVLKATVAAWKQEPVFNGRAVDFVGMTPTSTEPPA